MPAPDASASVADAPIADVAPAIDAVSCPADCCAGYLAGCLANTCYPPQGCWRIDCSYGQPIICAP